MNGIDILIMIGIFLLGCAVLAQMEIDANDRERERRRWQMRERAWEEVEQIDFTTRAFGYEPVSNADIIWTINHNQASY